MSRPCGSRGQSLEPAPRPKDVVLLFNKSQHLATKNNKHVIKHREKSSGKVPSSRYKIESPHGFFHVSKSYVTRINVVGEKNKNSYKIEEYLVARGPLPNIAYPPNVGERLVRGWWFPDLQIFYDQVYQKIRRRHWNCDAWSKGSFSYKYSHSNKSIAGTVFSLHEQINEYYKKTKPTSICVNITTNYKTCKRLRCNQWSDSNFKAGSYLVKSKKEALKLFDLIK